MRLCHQWVVVPLVFLLEAGSACLSLKLELSSPGSSELHTIDFLKIISVPILSSIWPLASDTTVCAEGERSKKLSLIELERFLVVAGCTGVSFEEDILLWIIMVS